MRAKTGRPKKAPVATRKRSLTDVDHYVDRLAESASILLWCIDAKGILTFTRGPGYEQLGTSAEDVLGKSVYEEFADFKEAIAYYERALQGETLHHQFTRRGRVLENHYFPALDAAGRVIGVNGFSFDVTDRVAAEERARRSHGFLEEAQALAEIGCWEYDIAADRTTWSDEVYRIYRAEPGSFTPTNDMLLSRVMPEDRALFEAALAQLDREGESQAVYRIRRTDGSRAILHARGRIERDAAGNPVRLFGTVQDVTEREAKKVELRSAKQGLAEAQRLARIGSWEWDLEGDAVRWSDQVYVLMGVPRDAVDLRERFRERIHPDDLERVTRARERGATQTFPTIVYRIVHPVEGVRVLESRAEVAYDEAGQPSKVIGTIQDVTEREAVRDELRHAKEAMAEAQRIAQIGNWELDLDPVAVRWSEHAYTMLGVDRNTPNLGDAFSSRIHPDDRERVEELVRAAVQDGASYPVHTYRLLHPVHGLRVFEARGEVVRDATGRVVRMVGTMQDVTEREAGRTELRRAQEGFAEAQKVARLGIWEWLDGVDEGRWSDEVYEIFGIPPTAPPTSLTYFRCIHPDDRERLIAVAKQTLEEDVPYPTTLYRVVRGEKEHIVEQRANVLRDVAGKPIGFIGTVQDVTEREQARERLATLTTALDQAADAVFITDRDGVIAYANEAFYRQTQYSPYDVVARTPRVLKSGIHDEVFYAELWKRLREDETWHGTFVNRRKDGSFYEEDMTITALRDVEGRITHYVATGRDVTEKRNAERTQAALQQAVARSAQEWRATFDAVDSPILIMEADGRVRRPNRAARDLLDKPYLEIMRAPLESLAPGQPWAGMAEAARRVGATEKAAALQAVDAATGQTWDIGASPLFGTDVPDGGVIVLARDVTPVVKLQESLRATETMTAMGRLVAGVAHEVRNPLFGISATLDAFDLDFSDRPEYQQYSERLRNEVGRLTELMHDLLEYGKPAPAQLNPADLEPVLQKAVRVCGASAKKAGVGLAARVAGPLPVRLDPGRLAQVFQNLLENAIQHSRPESEVCAVASRSAGGATVEVEILDSGPGFRDGDAERVFEPFFTRRRGGTGLGLSIVRQIVAQHGGEVSVGNREGGGARVLVILPVHEP